MLNRIRTAISAATDRQYVSCPCCGRRRAKSLSAPPINQELALQRAGLGPWWGKPGWSISEKISVQWACNSCLQGGRAIPANPSKQLYCDFPPYFAYFDTTHRCESCGSSFVFSKEEQSFWYETRGFWVQSRPKQCAKCRAARRRRRSVSIQLQRAIDTLDNTDPLQLATVAHLLLESGSESKAIVYLRRAKNRARTEEQRASLAKQLEELQSRNSTV